MKIACNKCEQVTSDDLLDNNKWLRVRTDYSTFLLCPQCVEGFWKAIDSQETALTDELLWQEIYSLREKLKIAVEAIKSYDPTFDDQEFLHRLNSVDYDQLMEELSMEEEET